MNAGMGGGKGMLDETDEEFDIYRNCLEIYFGSSNSVFLSRIFKSIVL
jgi:hypothetical protein